MTGSIEKRGKNSYRLVVFKGYDLDGRSIRHQKTILEHHRLLSTMLHKALYWQLIVSNPAERVQPPKTSKPLRRHYDEEQTKILVDNLQKLKGNQIKYCTEILLGIFTGARLGHAQITTTYNCYVHPLKSHDRTAGNVLENLLISSKAN